MAKTKKSKPVWDMRLTFATDKFASIFASRIESEYPSCTARAICDGVDIQAPEAILSLIKSVSEDSVYRRTGISIFNPCLLKKGNHNK